MPLALENTCPSCDGWKGEDYELCKSCSDDERAERDEPVLVEFARRAGETELAVLYKLPGGFMARDLWVPKSILRDEDALAKRICVPRWWAEQESVEHE